MLSYVQITTLMFICQIFREIVSKGSKLKDDPKSPVFLGLEVKRASDLWEETNSVAMDRLNRLRGEHFLWAPSEIIFFILFLDNLSAWERYENKRNDLGKDENKLFNCEAHLNICTCALSICLSVRLSVCPSVRPFQN